MTQHKTTEIGEIVRLLSENKAKVKVKKHSSCQGCAHRSFCDPFGSEHMVIQAVNYVNAQIGNTVEVEFGVEKASKAIIILYIIPLIFLILGAFLGNFFNPFNNQDISAAIFSLVFVILSFIGIYFYSHRQFETNPSGQPKITKILPN